MSERRFHELDTIVVRGLQAGIALCRARSDVVPHLVAMLHAGLSRLLAEQGALELRCAGQFLLLNGERTPGGDDDRMFARRLSRALRHRGLDGLRIEPGLGVGELHAALEVLGRAGLPGDPLPDVPGRLRRADVVHVVPLEHESACRPPAAVGMSLHRAIAQRLYLRAVRLHEELCEALVRGRPVPLHEVKRVLQRMVDLMREDDAALLGL
ncbi:MAG: hypothetical protein ACE5G2_11395, partial [Candidatus Krumholzibacteriia bacterium]